MFNSNEFSLNANYEVEPNIANIFTASLQTTYSNLIAASKSNSFLPAIAPIFNRSGLNLKNRGFDLPTIANSVKSGITTSDGTNLNYTDVAIALWNSGYGATDGLDSRKLADLLWYLGANPIAIGQAMKYLKLMPMQ